MSNPKIVMALLSKEQEFQLLQSTDATSAARRHGFDLDVVFAKNNSTLQAEQIYHFIHAPEAARPVAIVAQTVAGDGLPKVARDAVKAGIGWVLLNRDVSYIDALRTEHPRLPIAIVTSDQRGIGRIQGTQFRKALPHGGHVLYVQGPADTSAASERLQGVRDEIDGSGIRLTILNAEWTEVSGEKAMASWLRLSSSREAMIDLIAAQNDAMAMGARKAIASSRPEWLTRPFLGCDGLSEGGQQLVRQGQLAATIIVHPTAGAAVNLIAEQRRDGTALPARTVLPARPFPG